MIRKLLALRRVRLVQFVVVGGALFAATPRAGDARSIALSGAEVRALVAADATRGARAPGAERRDAIVERAIEDEVLYREGLRLGVQRDDAVVRQRVVQKVLFLAEEMAGASRPPTDAELRAFYAAHLDRFAAPSRVRFHHVFAATAEALAASDASGAPSAAGRPTPVPSEYEDEVPALASRLGQDFANAVSALPVGTWSAPIPSSFGFHRVLVRERRPGAPLPFEAARRRVAEEFDVARRQDAVSAFLSKTLAHYDVEVEGRPLRALAPSGRVAYRTNPSAED